MNDFLNTTKAIKKGKMADRKNRLSAMDLDSADAAPVPAAQPAATSTTSNSSGFFGTISRSSKSLFAKSSDPAPEPATAEEPTAAADNTGRQQPRNTFKRVRSVFSSRPSVAPPPPVPDGFQAFANAGQSSRPAFKPASRTNGPITGTSGNNGRKAGSDLELEDI